MTSTRRIGFAPRKGAVLQSKTNRCSPNAVVSRLTHLLPVKVFLPLLIFILCRLEKPFAVGFYHIERLRYSSDVSHAVLHA